MLALFNLFILSFLILPLNQLSAEVTKVKFPEDVDSLIHYTTVRRGDVMEHIKGSPAAIEAVKNKKPIPNGSKFVLVDYRSGKLYRYFVMEKGAGWGNEYDKRVRNGDWQYQWFWADKSVNMKEDTTRCLSCHQSQESEQYLYTGYRIPHFNGKPVE